MPKPTPPIRQLRQERDWSLKDLSKASGVSVSDLCDFERGRKISIDKMFAAANALDTTIAALLGDKPSTGGTDTCIYCGFSYHPMPRWSKWQKLIFVCDDQVKETVGEESTGCNSRAKADGYTYRPDLTPKR